MRKKIWGQALAAGLSAVMMMDAMETAAFADITTAVVASPPAQMQDLSQLADGQGGDSSKGGVIVVGSSSMGGIRTEGEKNEAVQPLLGGASLTMLCSQDNMQILSCIIQTNGGSLIVVDGGTGSDADYLTSQIQARGGHVSAWLVTHPHGDHVGALYQILQNEDMRYVSGQPAGIVIDQIYYSFADVGWYLENDLGDSEIEGAIIGSLSRRPSMLHPVSRGETFQVDTATVQVMNSRYETATNKVNNSSIVYKVTVNGVSILFLGDMGYEGGNALLAEAGAEALKSDIVQMAHHGQGGVSEELYRAVAPSVCLWPTPDWLWYSAEGKYTIQTTKQWMLSLGVQRHYCMKDGDQVIY